MLLDDLPRWTLMVAGLVAGLRHALEADHVAAVSAFATRAARPFDAARMSAQWAMGHGAVLLAAVAIGGSFGLIARPTAQVAELTVAATLLYLGRGLVRRRAAAASQHAHGLMRPWAVGGLHGIAGSGAVAVGVAAGLGFAGAFGYTLALAIGALGGMVALGYAIGLGASGASSHAQRLAWAADILCIATAIELTVAVMR